jgi:DNA adenine methylase
VLNRSSDSLDTDSLPAATGRIADRQVQPDPLLPGLNLEPANDVRPFLKWAGGKTRLLSTILPHMPSTFTNYHEPFLGAGSVFFAIRRRAAGRCYLSDLNTDLINVWCAVQKQPDKLLGALGRYSGLDSEKEYYAVRESDWPENQIERAARFLYLNQTAWNGLWRVNKHGVFNVPWGARPFRGLNGDDVRAVTYALRDTNVAELDFRDALQRPKRGDFVYLDPPYLPVSDTSKFHGYTERRFRAADLAELAKICRELTDRGVWWAMSNRDSPLVRELFSHARVVRFTTRRSVAAQNKRDIEPVASPEVIVLGGGL